MSTISSFDPKLPARLPHKGLLHHVESKLGEGDKRGAARVLFSSDVVAPYSPETFTALESKHPAAANDLSFPDPNDTDPLYITAIQLRSAVNSFRSGSAGGLDGLTPQHLKDLTSASAGEADTLPNYYIKTIFSNLLLDVNRVTLLGQSFLV
ncbi:hypothetical protein B5X24_HaOG204170 [Helicoverpa armigera]|uniref:Reverse transcriptase domain-containing protein n=1 Tax=Helicoverpa armigera TaxID=29058 RepID=A0A2W1BVQ1_HELAM|nr:hypothetical protein B5X24_HaOG204170 [Helicoverpa armigera]